MPLTHPVQIGHINGNEAKDTSNQLILFYFDKLFNMLTLQKLSWYDDEE